jgi:hypothetical protein
LLYRIESDNRPNWFEASSLPPGLKFNPNLGLISGIPTQSGTFPVPVKAVNLFGSTSATITFTIDDGAIIGGSSPILAMSRGANTLLLSWPAASGAFILEETELTTQTWTPSSANVSVEDTNNVVAIPISGAAKFYRLRK